jgi:beta-glucanase (GH16 family)
MRWFGLLALVAVLSVPLAAQEKWRLIWHDEFDGPVGAPPDPALWVAETGDHGWGNHELEHYTKLPENALLDGDGHLVIMALAKPGGVYTSARLKTQNLFSVTYGKIEARMRLPYGQGMWPAFWMMGADYADKGWPACGEIDIMENIGKEPFTIHGTVHGPGYSGAGGIGGTAVLGTGRHLSDDFHVFAVVWEENSIRFLLDGEPYFRVTPSRLPAGAHWVFDHPFFLLLNLAIGGDWPGPPDRTTEFPQRLTVDYVRIYAEADHLLRRQQYGPAKR